MATITNGQTYNSNLIEHQLSQTTGTPNRPGNTTEAYTFAISNENFKPAANGQNFNMTEVYPVNLSDPLSILTREIMHPQVEQMVPINPYSHNPIFSPYSRANGSSAISCAIIAMQPSKY